MVPSPTPSRLQHPDGLDDMLLYRINRLRAIGGGMVLRYCEGRFGVTRREWVVLALLNTHGPESSSDLATHAMLDKSAMSKAIAGLVKKGLVSRNTRRGDRRYTEVDLTAVGRALYRQILPVVKGINRDMLSALDDAETAQLDQFLDRIQARALQMQELAPSLPRADRRHGGTRHHDGT